MDNDVRKSVAKITGATLLGLALVAAVTDCSENTVKPASQTDTPFPTADRSVLLTHAARPTSAPKPTQETDYVLEVQDFNCGRSSTGFVTLEGEGKNISGNRLENVMAVASWYTRMRPPSPAMMHC